MIILPAIDLKDGQCVRLVKGEFSTAHKVAEDPAQTAQTFRDCGASFIHVVDLDGSLQGKCVNRTAIEAILSAGVPVELGGGVRSMDTLIDLLEMGVSRVILGSAALKDPAFVREALAAYGDRIAVGIDAKQGMVAVEGWKETSRVDYLEFAREMDALGVGNLIFTDISRDGTLTGPNLEQLGALCDAVSCKVTASGGVKDLSHIRQLMELGVYGAIVGKAIYAGTLDLRQAIALTREGEG
ncbi:MAG: 1-(5-phosphoribosyl)-5-[(5-phosphoribosylamino)methylideneamino]imidazole-4-carboxamide isomerase [Eubacteriales bacterium]|jgi:phosphoribosylformimino-5-aminoimidazole carboxamide ribotide isomerase